MRQIKWDNSLIVACDPGIRTGWASYWIVGGDLVYQRFEETQGLAGVFEFLDERLGYLPKPGARPDLHIVAENFVPELGRAVDFTALRVLGALEYRAQRLGATYTQQSRAGREKYMPDGVMNDLLKVRFKGNADRNIKEAARHGLVFMKSNNCPAVVKYYRNKQTNERVAK